MERNEIPFYVEKIPVLSVEQARDLILAEARPLPAERVPLLEALGHVLAEEVISDVDSPPHDKTTVDGYAVVAPLEVPAKLRVLEEITAGQLPTQTVEPGSATRIMTGAPLPQGANAVVMVERTEVVDEGGRRDVRILHAPQVGQNIVRRGQSIRRGKPVLAAGTVLRGIEVGILAEVGKSQVSACLWPRLGVLATGNELVPVDQKPAAGQIRNSNGPLLTTLAAQAGASAFHAGIARDDATDLRLKMRVGLAADVCLLSGGVSAGVLDLVPHVLVQCGVREVFHQVNLKPGKPLWFGVKDEGQHRTLVFGLPGNPVSTLVCFELFVRPAILKLAGHKDCVQQPLPAALTSDHAQRGERVTYWPSRLDETAASTRQVTPLPWQGSGDLRTLADANALAIFPGENRQFAAGEPVSVLRL
jgi:molybdopterin molybdotransferase